MENPLYGSRRNIYDLDPLLVDVILATSFDWKELANRLCSSGRVLPRSSSGMLKLPQVTYRMALTACSIDCPFSRDLAATLDYLHERILKKVQGMGLDGICSCVQEVSLKNRPHTAGLLWALATDERRSVQKVARVFLHRIMSEVFSSLYGTNDDAEFESIRRAFHKR